MSLFLLILHVRAVTSTLGKTTGPEGNYIQTSCRPGKGWVLPGYSCTRHTTCYTTMTKPSYETGDNDNPFVKRKLDYVWKNQIVSTVQFFYK